MGKTDELLQSFKTIGLFNHLLQTGDEQNFVDRRVIIETLPPGLAGNLKIMNIIE